MRRSRRAFISINELILVYRRHAQSYYRKDGEVTREAEIIDEVLRFLRQAPWERSGPQFGPLALDNLRDKMIDDLDWSRKYINKQVSRLSVCSNGRWRMNWSMPKFIRRSRS